MVYNPRAFIPHAALLRQAFAHCAKFLTAASRRSLGRVSVPVWLIILSDQLPVKGLVSPYLTNYLMGHEPLHKRREHTRLYCAKGIHAAYAVLARLSTGYSPLVGRLLVYYSAVCH